jgi:type IV secretion system protein VirD4
MTIPLGYWDNSFKEPLKYPGHAHGILCGPTRSGKFRDILCQILMSYTGSMFVIDNKAQAAAVTARYRRDVLGQDVCVLNPFNILPDYIGRFPHAQYDPVASQVDPKSDTFAADADTLYEGIMPLGGPETHWVHSARAMGSGVTMAQRELEIDASLPDALATIGNTHFFQYCQNVFDQWPARYFVPVR